MFRIPGVLPAETVIDQIVEHITGPFTNVLKKNQFFIKKKKRRRNEMKVTLKLVVDKRAIEMLGS